VASGDFNDDGDGVAFCLFAWEGLENVIEMGRKGKRQHRLRWFAFFGLIQISGSDAQRPGFRAPCALGGTVYFVRDNAGAVKCRVAAGSRGFTNDPG
jgi:hypothetical protein